MPQWKYVTASAAIAAYLVTRQYPTLWPWTIFVIPFAWALYAGFLMLIYPFYFSPFRDLPEPEGGDSLPWAHAGLMLNKHNGAPFRPWISSMPNDGMMRIRVFLNQERLFLTSPEAIKEVTVTRTYDFAKPPQAGFIFRQLLGNGVLIAEGSEHQRQRKALMPAFSYRHVKDLYPLFWSKSRQSTDEIARATQATVGHLTPQKAYDWASRVTLDIIGLAGMGHEFDSIGKSEGEVVTIYRALFDNEPPPLRWTILGIRVPIKLMWRLPLPALAQAKKSADAIKDFAYRMVKDKRVALEKDNNGGMIDIMSVAMRSGQFTDDDVVDQMMTFLAAGHETTASALTWGIYLMCKHPDIQQRLRKEIRGSLPSISSPTSTITAADFEKTPYLHAVCNEILRFIPSVPISPRDAVVDTELLGRRIPKGTRLFMSPWATNVDSKVWGPTAHAFDPERWMGEGMANHGGVKNNFANLTFLHGPRSCIGQGFAKAELEVLMAAWVGRFRVRWEDEKRPLDTDIVGTVTVHPGHKLPIVFEEVEGW